MRTLCEPRPCFLLALLSFTDNDFIFKSEKRMRRFGGKAVGQEQGAEASRAPIFFFSFAKNSLYPKKVVSLLAAMFFDLFSALQNYLLHNLVLHHQRACFLPSGNFYESFRARILRCILLAQQLPHLPSLPVD